MQYNAMNFRKVRKCLGFSRMPGTAGVNQLNIYIVVIIHLLCVGVETRSK